MNVQKVLRGISVLAIVLAGFATGVASAAPSSGLAASTLSDACQLTFAGGDASQLTYMTGTYLPGMAGASCSTADASSAFSQMTGTYLPGMAGSETKTACSVPDATLLVHMTGTYLPGLSGATC